MENYPNAPRATKPVRRCRVPDYGPWPPVGYVTPRKVMAALGDVSDETLRTYERTGLLPQRQPITGGQGGWPVDVMREAIAALPAKLKDRAEMRRRDKIESLKKARAARRAGDARAQQGFANVMLVLMTAIVAVVLAVALAGAWTHVGALITGIGTALAMVVPVGVGGLAVEAEADPVSAAIAGERAALRVLRRIRDNVGHGDELLGELRDVIHDDAGHVEATPRLRAFLRTLSKAIEVRP